MTQAQVQEAKAYLKPMEAAARIGVSRATFYRILERGFAKPSYIGVGPRHKRWAVSDIDAWMESRKKAF
jgi:predicted DNA-binding transcriptional regulator AlpA